MLDDVVDLLPRARIIQRPPWRERETNPGSSRLVKATTNEPRSRARWRRRGEREEGWDDDEDDGGGGGSGRDLTRVSLGSRR
jgi:hypothetical protein